MTTLTLPFTEAEKQPVSESLDEWTFANSPTRNLTHCYHDYPARMIPQVAAKLLQMFACDSSSGEKKLLFDPYCGTGTTLVEGLCHGLSVCGTDLNPLARLIAEAKTTKIDPVRLHALIKECESFVFERRGSELEVAELNEVKVCGVSDWTFGSSHR